MIKHASTRTTHTIEVDDMDANLVAGFLWEALDKLQQRNPDDTITVQTTAAAADAMRAFFAAAGHDHGKYPGTDLFKAGVAG